MYSGEVHISLRNSFRCPRCSGEYYTSAPNSAIGDREYICRRTKCRWRGPAEKSFTIPRASVSVKSEVQLIENLPISDHYALAGPLDRQYVVRLIRRATNSARTENITAPTIQLAASRAEEANIEWETTSIELIFG